MTVNKDGGVLVLCGEIRPEAGLGKGCFADSRMFVCFNG